MFIAETLIPAVPEMPEMLSFCAVGFLIVMCVLAIQSSIMALIGKVFISIEASKKEKEKAQS